MLRDALHLLDMCCGQRERRLNWTHAGLVVHLLIVLSLQIYALFTLILMAYVNALYCSLDKLFIGLLQPHIVKAYVQYLKLCLKSVNF